MSIRTTISSILVLSFLSATGMNAADSDKTKDEIKDKAKTEIKKEIEKRLPSESDNTDTLLTQLDSTEPLVQIAAIRALAAKKEEKANPKLISLLETSKDRGVLWNSARALGVINAQKKGPATDALIKVATASKYKTVRYAAVLSLASIGDDSKKTELCGVLKWTLQDEKSDDEFAKDLAKKLVEKSTLIKWKCDI